MPFEILSSTFSTASIFLSTSTTAVQPMNYSHSLRLLSQHIFRSFHQKLFFFCRINRRALLMCTFWRWKSLLRDPLARVFHSPSHTDLHKTNKTSPCLSQEGSGRSESPVQTVRCGSVSLRLMACQREVTGQTGQPLLPETLHHTSSNSPLGRQAWDADYVLG